MIGQLLINSAHGAELERTALSSFSSCGYSPGVFGLSRKGAFR
jgi:hypothetical protein